MIEYFYYFCEINNAIRIPAEGSDPGRPIHMAGHPLFMAPVVIRKADTK